MSAIDAAKSVKDPGLARLLIRLKEIIEETDPCGSKKLSGDEGNSC